MIGRWSILCVLVLCTPAVLAYGEYEPEAFEPIPSIPPPAYDGEYMNDQMAPNLPFPPRFAQMHMEQGMESEAGADMGMEMGMEGEAGMDQPMEHAAEYDYPMDSHQPYPEDMPEDSALIEQQSIPSKLRKLGRSMKRAAKGTARVVKHVAKETAKAVVKGTKKGFSKLVRSARHIKDKLHKISKKRSKKSKKYKKSKHSKKYKKSGFSNFPKQHRIVPTRAKFGVFTKTADCESGNCQNPTIVDPGAKIQFGKPVEPDKLAMALTAVKEEIMARSHELRAEKSWTKQVEALMADYQKKVKKVNANIETLKGQTKDLLKKKKQIQNAQMQEKLLFKLKQANANLSKLKDQMGHIQNKEVEFMDTEKQLKSTMDNLKTHLTVLKGQDPAKVKKEEAKAAAAKAEAAAAKPATS